MIARHRPSTGCRRAADAAAIRVAARVTPCFALAPSGPPHAARPLAGGERGVARIYEYAGIRPVIDASAFVHPEAVIIGDVIIGAGVYIAPLASLRGDLGRLIIEAGANVQDGCVMHGFPDKDCVIEEDGHVGHGAVLHGCRIGRNALVGMNATVMDGAVVGANAFVAAMAFVSHKTFIIHTIIESRALQFDALHQQSYLWNHM